MAYTNEMCILMQHSYMWATFLVYYLMNLNIISDCLCKHSDFSHIFG